MRAYFLPSGRCRRASAATRDVARVHQLYPSVTLGQIDAFCAGASGRLGSSADAVVDVVAGTGRSRDSSAWPAPGRHDGTVRRGALLEERHVFDPARFAVSSR